jgi:alpha-L-fucosidase
MRNIREIFKINIDFKNKHMKKLLTILVCFFSFEITFSQDNDALREDWQKMHSTKEDLYKSYNDAKFGMFIHFGVYSKLGGMWKGVKIEPPAYRESLLGEWIMYAAEIPRDEYRDIAKTFDPEGFNAEEWVKMAKEAGMRYIVAMAKHHEGFAMYHSKVSKYNIYDLTPFKRDPIEELYKACLKFGLRFGLYYSHSIDWMDGGDAGVAQAKREDPELLDSAAANTWDPSPVSYRDYIRNKALPQMRELLTRFPGMIEIWYDFPRFMSLRQSFEFYKLAYDIQPNCLINSRVGNGLGDVLTAGDNEIPSTIDCRYKAWETPGTMNDTWGYKSYDHDWKSLNEMIFWLVEIASKGGNYLLNVGPDGNGMFPAESVKILKGIGAWMKINGEAIYGTTRWTTMKEGPISLEMKSTGEREEKGFHTVFTPEDFWFTKKDNYVYAISLAAPVNNTVSVKSLYDYYGQIKKITLLGEETALKWKVASGKVNIAMPSGSKVYKYGFVLKVELK